MSSLIDGESTGVTTVLRNEPVQARSAARLTSLLDATASVVAEIGYERLTTAMIAERAGSSIGTVYRYFPDRLAVLNALTARSLARFMTEGVPRIDSPENTTWLDAIDVTLDYWVDAFLSEPGFASLRFGDVLDLRPRPEGQTNNGLVASAVVSVLTTRHGMESDGDLQFHIEVALELCDAAVARGFALDPKGDDRFTTAGLTTAKNYLIDFYGDPRVTK
ncbi:TetR/AcrR family transcriptional regulator [Marisediminicola senii]|uniref:TetR/AcrR family transcriptional regulator n=1 Tax=Marisediminicola senii TaxID=2711233 RepID=UPI0013E9DF07|nr:TetR/AcrR family transcriptional regulator [Marisediminicola senii]